MTTTISISSGVIVEGDSNNQLVFTVSLSEPLTQDITLNYSTLNGSATSGADYTAVSNAPLVFKAGETVKTISITILNDNITELDENFLVNLFIPRNTFLNPSSSDQLAATGVGNITDTLSTSATTTLSSTVENLTLTGTAIINGIGNNGNNILTGNSANNTLEGLSGNDTLDGGAGADILKGGVGDDTYIIDSTDTIVEDINSGVDTVRAGFDYTLGDNLENLILTGTATTGTGNSSNNILIGNSANNTLDGGAGNDTLDGGAGADILKGGVGDDTYIVDSTDTIVEDADAGTDTVKAGFSYTLADKLNLENLTLTGTSNINGTGNSKNNILIGNSNSNTLSGGDGNDVLDGGGGVDTLIGGSGDDLYILDNPGDIITEAANSGIDTVQVGFSYVLQEGSNLEKLVLTGGDNLEGVGNSLNNTITGNNGNNYIDGMAGADVMVGGNGNDTYIVDNISDVISESGGGGTYAVESSVNYSLTANVENLTLTGTATTGTGNISNNILIGNELNNTLAGDAGNDILDGGTGVDTLNGGIGNDIYVVDNAGDIVTETSTVATEIDLIQASVSYTLSANVENLTLTGTANTNGTGNNSNNTLLGNIANNILDGKDGNDIIKGEAGNDTLNGGIGNDTLDGGTGRDILKGGAGDDSYIVDSYLDAVTENASEGNDLVQSSVSFLLGSNLEKLTLTGSGNTDGTGNELANSIIGNGGVNSLDGRDGDDYMDGGGGDDTLYGGVGNDTLKVGQFLDVVVEAANEGTDTVISSSLDYIISANIEKLTLSGGNINGTGNELNNQIIGTSGANIIDGGAGIDTMTGGLGNDIYMVDNSSDVVNETSTLSTELDTVMSSVTYTLSANVEKLLLTGSANINGTGNSGYYTLINGVNTLVGAKNTLIGNAGSNTLSGLDGNDTLNGGGGSDTLIGGQGNDTYIFDNDIDIVTEAAGEGTDLVMSAFSYTLVANVENLTLTGAATLNGTGNELNNLINGNTGDNILKGATGNDTLIGGAGNDILVGQAENDTLLGGLGADKFNYNTGVGFSAADLGSDRINDFKQNGDLDKLVLGKTTFGLTSALGNGFSVASEFASVATDDLAKASAATIVYSQASGNLFYNANGATVGSEAIFTTLRQSVLSPTTNTTSLVNPTLTASDFIIEA